MSKLFTALCAILSLTLTACTGNPPSKSFDSDRPAVEVRAGIPSQQRGARGMNPQQVKFVIKLLNGEY